MGVSCGLKSLLMLRMPLKFFTVLEERVFKLKNLFRDSERKNHLTILFKTIQNNHRY